MRKTMVFLFIILISLGIAIMVKHERDTKQEMIKSKTLIEETSENFIDPHTIQDPGVTPDSQYDKRETFPNGSN